VKKLAVFLVLLGLIGLVVAWSGASYTSQRFVSFGATVPERPVIEVVSPERGQGVWIFDNLQTIKWRYRGFTGEYLGFNMGAAEVYLWFPDGGVCHIGSAPVIKGKFSFTLKENQSCNNIPRKITSGQYQIIVIVGNKNFFIESRNSPSVTLIRHDSLNIPAGPFSGFE
jgi:hypothetical protein